MRADQSLMNGWVESADMLSLRFQIYTQEKPHSFRANHLPFMRFVYILEGEGMFCADNMSVLRAKPWDVLFIPAQTSYTSHWATNTSIFVLDIAQSQSGDDSIWKYDGVQRLFEDHNGIVREAIQQIIECRQRPDPYQLLTCTSLVFKALVDMVQGQKRASEEQPPIYNALLYLRYNFEKDTSTAELARMCSFSESQFRRIFKACTSMSPTEYRNYLRICSAEQLLLTQDLTIAQVAEKVGFSNANYFYRLYKKYHDNSPRKDMGMA